MSKRIEACANLAIILVTVAIFAVLGKQEFFAKRQSTLQPVSIGSKLSLPGLNWSSKPAHLLLAVQEGCHFCSGSAEFYRKLSTALAGSDIHLVAVLPQEVAEGKKYLSGLGVDITDVRRGSLSDLGITGVPTLVLVDSLGTVKNVWPGKLSPEREAEVLKTLDVGDSVGCDSCPGTAGSQRPVRPVTASSKGD
jgi:hypothetical protein